MDASFMCPISALGSDGKVGQLDVAERRFSVLAYNGYPLVHLDQTSNRSNQVRNDTRKSSCDLQISQAPSTKATHKSAYLHRNSPDKLDINHCEPASGCNGITPVWSSDFSRFPIETESQNKVEKMTNRKYWTYKKRLFRLRFVQSPMKTPFEPIASQLKRNTASAQLIKQHIEYLIRLNENIVDGGQWNDNELRSYRERVEKVAQSRVVKPNTFELVGNQVKDDIVVTKSFNVIRATGSESHSEQCASRIANPASALVNDTSKLSSTTVSLVEGQPSQSSIDSLVSSIDSNANQQYNEVKKPDKSAVDWPSNGESNQIPWNIPAGFYEEIWLMEHQRQMRLREQVNSGLQTAMLLYHHRQLDGLSHLNFHHQLMLIDAGWSPIVQNQYGEIFTYDFFNY